MITNTRRIACAAVLLSIACPAPAAPARQPYDPMAFLVGHCWKGVFPGSPRTDEHCFSWMYGGRFLRDEHTVHSAAGAPDQFGETIYLWNPATGQLEYLYVESSGGFIRGSVTTEGTTLVFPAAGYLEGGTSMSVRSRWQRAGEDAYDVVTEFQVQDRWVPGFSLHMQRVRPMP